MATRTARQNGRDSGFTRVPIDDGLPADGAVELPGNPAIDTSLVRKRLERLHELAGDELERRRNTAELEPYVGAPVAIRRLSSISREMPRLARNAPHAAVEVLSAARVEELRHLLSSAAQFVARQMELAGRHSRGDIETDDFGFDVEWTESLLPLFRFLYDHYWRVRTTGMENVPGEGRALMVSNHAGVLPFDGAMIRSGIIAEHPQPRRQHPGASRRRRAAPGSRRAGAGLP